MVSGEHDPPIRLPARQHRPRGSVAGIIVSMERDESVDIPTTMPGKHGGTLRRGGSPGRPAGTAQANVQAYIRDRLFFNPKLDAMGIIDVLVMRALKGDIRAIELALAYGIGKPTERIDLTVGIREAVSRVADELGIDDTLVQAQLDGILARAGKPR